MPIAPFPHRYAVALDGEFLAAEPRESIRTGSPPEFGGTPDVWSPEQLLVAAALTCLKTTFDAYARREHITVHTWRGVGTGVLVKGREGPTFSNIDLDVEIVVDAGDEARAREVLATAERHCIVARSLVVPVHVVGAVTAAPVHAAG